MSDNPYHVELAETGVERPTGDWSSAERAILLKSGLLLRQIRVVDPVDCLVEYRANQLSDQVLVDGIAVVSRLPIFWLHEKFEFRIQKGSQQWPARIRVKVGRLLRILSFELWIDDQLIYSEYGQADHKADAGKAS